ncbi:MAG: hypothetical protein AAGE98_15160 [Actinomycetota bacterium]
MRLASRFLGALAMVVALGAMAFMIRNDLDEVGDTRADASQEYATLQCLGVRLLERLPEDAVVTILPPELSPARYWDQRIWELLSPERSVTDDPSEADHDVRVRADPDAPCAGVEAVVTER